jgi:hypothetical protein
MVGGFKDYYRKTVSPLITRHCGDERCECRAWQLPESSPRSGHASDNWYALWTKDYRVGHDPEGRLVAAFTGIEVLALRRAGQQAESPEPDEDLRNMKLILAVRKLLMWDGKFDYPSSQQGNQESSQGGAIE